MNITQFLTIISVVTLMNSCSPHRSIPKDIKKEINTIDHNKFNTELDLLQESMLTYMEMGNPSYKKKDVEECIHILKLYLKNISASTSKNEGMNLVQSTIEKLNSLNERCSSTLIETNEREIITNIIISASADKGYNTIDEDITEQWRKW